MGEKLNEWFTELFDNDETLKNIKSVVAIALALGLGALFFGLFSSENLKALFTVNVAGLTIIAMLSVWVWRVDLQDRAFDDEFKSNKELQEIDDEILKVSKIDRNEDYCMLYADEYNYNKRKMLNQRKTNKRIKSYNDKISILKLSTRDLKWYQSLFKLVVILIPFAKIKDIKYYEKQIAKLHRKPLVDKNYKDIVPKKILSAKTEKGNKEEHGAALTEYNPKLDGTKKSLVFSLFKFAGIGGTGNMIFKNTTDPKTIITYYLLLIASLIWVTVRRYPKVRKNTRTKYVVTRQNKLKLMKEMIAWKPQEIITEPIQIEGGSVPDILENTKEEENEN